VRVATRLSSALLGHSARFAEEAQHVQSQFFSLSFMYAHEVGGFRSAILDFIHQ
jgi:hypothetical protein